MDFDFSGKTKLLLLTYFLLIFDSMASLHIYSRFLFRCQFPVFVQSDCIMQDFLFIFSAGDAWWDTNYPQITINFC